MSYDGECRSCRWLSGVKRGPAEKRLCVRGHVFAAIAGGAMLPTLDNLRRADLTVKERCPEWEKR